MMILLDTHIAYWLLLDDDKIPDRIKKLIEENENDIYVSSVSIWEIEMKHNIDSSLIINGELFEKLCVKAGINIIPFTPSNIYDYQLFSLQNIHKDPFDLALLSTCIDKNYVLLTHDKKLKQYKGIPIIYF